MPSWMSSAQRSVGLPAPKPQISRTASAAAACLNPMLPAAAVVARKWRRPSILGLEQRRHDALAGERHVVDAHAQRMLHGVADGGGGRPDSAFADAQRAIAGTIDELDLHLRHLAEAQDGIALPVARGDALGVELDLLLQ